MESLCFLLRGACLGYVGVRLLCFRVGLFRFESKTSVRCTTSTYPVHIYTLGDGLYAVKYLLLVCFGGGTIQYCRAFRGPPDTLI